MSEKKAAKPANELPTVDCALEIATSLCAPLRRAASGQGCDWMGGNILSLRSSSLDRSSYYERCVRAWNNTYNFHSVERLQEFLRSNVSEALFFTSKYCHHPSKPENHPMQFFFEDDAIRGCVDYLHQFQYIFSLASDIYSEIGPIRVQSIDSSSVDCVGPVTMRGTIVVKLPLPRAMIARLRANNGIPTPQDLQDFRNIFTQLGSFKNYISLTPHAAGTAACDPFAPPSFPQSSAELSCWRANQYSPDYPYYSSLHLPNPSVSKFGDRNVADQLYSAMLVNCAALDDVELHTVCLPIRIQGVVHILFNIETRKAMRLDFVYYD